jgi:hypothetical protein
VAVELQIAKQLAVYEQARVVLVVYVRERSVALELVLEHAQAAAGRDRAQVKGEVRVASRVWSADAGLPQPVVRYIGIVEAVQVREVLLEMHGRGVRAVLQSAGPAGGGFHAHARRAAHRHVIHVLARVLVVVAHGVKLDVVARAELAVRLAGYKERELRAARDEHQVPRVERHAEARSGEVRVREAVDARLLYPHLERLAGADELLHLVRVAWRLGCGRLAAEREAHHDAAV